MAGDEEEDLEARQERADDFLRRMVTPVGSGGMAGLQWAQALEFAKDAPKDDGADGWTPIGPRNLGGAVRALVQHPTQPSTFYAGTSGGGLWRTTDDGNTWEPLAEDSIGGVPICALAIAPSNPQTIYAGTGEANPNYVGGIGLYRSEDGGTTFEKIASPGSAHDGDADHYARICVDPLEPRTAWAATERGLWRFENKSATQELSDTDVVTDLALVLDPTDQGNQLVLLAGVRGTGIRRGVYNRRRTRTTWAAASALTTSGGAAATQLGRVRVAISPSSPNTAYALIQDDAGAGGNDFPQPLYASANGGTSFAQPAVAGAWPVDVPGAAPSGIGWYALVLAVHPTNPAWVVAGHVNLCVTTNGGGAWTVALDWTRGREFPTRGEHGDVHAILMDSRDGGGPTQRMWIGDDGGVSFNDAWAAPFNWRKRSYGILGGQVVDVTSHPSFPSLVGIGLQDNGTYFGYGGPTWYHVGGGDGASLAFHPTDPRQAFTSWQYAQVALTVAPAAGGGHPQDLADVAAPSNQLTVSDTYLQVVNPPLPAPLAGTGVFRSLLLGDGVTPNRLAVAAVNGAWVTTTGASASFTQLATGAFTPGGNPEVGAMAFVPGSLSNNDIHVGTSTGDIFSPGAPAGTWVKRNPFTFGAGQPWVSAIAVHPTKPQVVAACAYQAQQRLMLSHNGGQSWFNATGSDKTLPDAPVTSLAFHPTDERVLYTGTLVGVFVARDLPAFNAGTPATTANPTWKTFNRGMGPVLVNDLEVVRGAGTLRAGTYGRGCFEASLRGQGATYFTPAGYRVPAVRLHIRKHAMDDSRTYTGGAAGSEFPDDPRLPAGVAAPHLSGEHSVDIKVNAPELRDRLTYLQSERFGHSPDGSELDEQFVCENPISGDINIAYVQVNNRGWNKAEDVQVFLYVADAGAAATAPTLNGLNFPGDPAPPWQLVGTQTQHVLPGQPRTYRFQFICPLAIQQNAALLAICRSGADELAPLPSGMPLAYIQVERRAALRILPVVPDRVRIRDGVDDRGQRGSVAWGGRSPDIIVMPKTDADLILPIDADDNAAGPFANLNDARRGDRVRQGDNTVFVRVHNQGAIPIDARVQLYRVPLNQITVGGAWPTVGAPFPIAGIQPRGWKMARFQLTGVPAGGVAGAVRDWQKAFVLVALVRALNPADGAELESIPDVGTVTGVDEFWTLFNRGALANNAAFRALRFTTTPLGGP